jgi:hypothetical protein
MMVCSAMLRVRKRQAVVTGEQDEKTAATAVHGEAVFYPITHGSRCTGPSDAIE